MTLGQSSARLLLAAGILASAGCVSRPAAPRSATTANEILPGHNQAQLLAAARQYEKEGRPDLATRYYRQVLALDPNNVEAQNGLNFVQSGKPRTETNYQEIVAAAQPKARPRLRTGEEFTRSTSVIDERTAQVIANAAARATAEAIANAAAKATAEYMASTAGAAQSLQAGTTPLPLVTVDSASPEPKTDEPAVRERVPVTTPPAPQTGPHKVAAQREFVTVEVVAGAAESQPAAEPRAIETISDASLSPASPHATARDAVDEPRWQSTSLTRLCHDANAAVLREVAKLDSKDPQTRQDGLRSLAQMGPDASSAALPVRMLLHDRVELVRAHAAWTLWESTADARSAVQPLTEILSSADPEVVQFAAYTLSGIGEPARAALSELRRLRDSDDQLTQLHAAEALGQIAPESERAAATETLILLTAQPDAEVRTLALLALGRVCERPTPSITTALTSALHDSDPEVRSAAALTLGGFGPAAASALVQLQFVAESDQREVKQAAAAALECIRREN